jgi:SpoVK/Ycf46/Vps4 family AAA+-type ATPase
MYNYLKNYYWSVIIKDKEIKKWILFSINNNNEYEIKVDNFGIEDDFFVKNKFNTRKASVMFKGTLININNEEEYIKLSIYSRNIKKQKQFINKFINKCKEEFNKKYEKIYNKTDRIEYYEFNNKWKHIANIPKRSIKSLSGKKPSIILNDLKQFLLDFEIYKKREIPYKRCYFLYGVNGMGKTSTVRMVASELNKPICHILLNENINDNILTNAFTTAPINSILLIENFDFYPNIYNKILNILDGISTVYGTILFIIGQNINNIPKNVIRKGRIDKIIKYNYISKKQMYQYYIDFFKNINIAFCDDIFQKYKNLTYSELQFIFIEHEKNISNLI